MAQTNTGPTIRLTNAGAAAILALAGLAVFIWEVGSQFQGDDLFQIVNNPPVHSLGNIGLFFRGSTFYNGNPQQPLSGSYYRPVMTTVFSLIYSVFGLTPAAYHVVQQLLLVGDAFLLYLVFLRFGFKPLLALTLSLVFLVHPLNAQIAFAIQNMQDALFFLFGILSIWLMLRSRSRKMLIAVAACLFLALLSKETALLFVLMDVIYLIWWNRSRLLAFGAIVAGPLMVWVLMRSGAVGLFVANAASGPIDRASLGERLLTIPSIVLHYLLSFVWPFRLAGRSYSVETGVTFGGFVLPVLVDAAVIAGGIVLGRIVARRAQNPLFRRTYVFFAVWTVLGLLPHLQLVPLDATVTDAWFQFSMAGLLGMFGVAVTVLGPTVRVSRAVPVMVSVVLVTVLGIGMALRGVAWNDPYVLAQQNLEYSPDWASYNNMASQELTRGQCDAAIRDGQASVALFPSGGNYLILGSAYSQTGHYAQAQNAYAKGLTYEGFYALADGMADLTTVHGKPADNRQLLGTLIEHLPGDPALWTFLAYLDYTNGNQIAARQEIAQAASLSPSNSTIAYLYQTMMAGAELKVHIAPPKCGEAELRG